MSALADEATKAALKMEVDMQRLWDDVKAAKCHCVDPAARDVLTRLQAEMFGIKADAQGIKALISAARQTRYFNPPQHVSTPPPDGRMLAAGDHTLEEES